MSDKYREVEQLELTDDQKWELLKAKIKEHKHPQHLTWTDPKTKKENITSDPVLRELLVEIVSKNPYMGPPESQPTPAGIDGYPRRKTVVLCRNDPC